MAVRRTPGRKVPGGRRTAVDRLGYGSGVAKSGAADLRELAAKLHAIAVSVIRSDGEHAPMFFLRLPSGEMDVQLFDEGERPVGPGRARQIAEAVRRTGADAVVAVSEGWSASQDAIPEGGLPGDARDARDVLVVAAVDRSGDEVMLTTDLLRRPDDSVEVGETEEGGQFFVFDELRRVWGR